jgi:hemerythrin-like domain-containing protein
MSIKQFLSNDHKACDEAFADLENAINDGKWEESEANLETMKNAFVRHFTMEEEAMFPAFEAASGMSCGPTQVMKMEHEQMRSAINKLAMAVAARDKNKALGCCETFNMLTQQHNSKEEQILYTMADNVLNSIEIVEKMQNV